MSDYVLRLAREALANAEQRCRYHGADFERMGTEVWSSAGLPRCDSCKQPWRVQRALAAIDRALAPPEAHTVEVTAGTPTPVWCQNCQTSAALAVPVVTAGESGVSTLDTAAGCPQCRTGVFTSTE